MRPLIQEVSTPQSPESLVEQLHDQPGVVLLRSASLDFPQARYSFVTARPFLTMRSFGSRCEIVPVAADVRKRTVAVSDSPNPPPYVGGYEQFGNPWHVLDGLMARYELLDEVDLPFPFGGCFGFWGYDLKNFVEPRLTRRAVNDLDLPDCHVGFYDSLVVFDHRIDRMWVVSTGLHPDGSRAQAHARRTMDWWLQRLIP